MFKTYFMKAFINYINILGISLLFLSCTARKTIVVNFDNSEKKIWAIEEINAELKNWIIMNSDF